MVEDSIEIPPGKRSDVAILEEREEISGVFKSLRYRRPRWPYCSKPWCPSSRIYLKNLGLFVGPSTKLPLKGKVSVGLKQETFSKILSSLASLGPGGIHGGFRTRYHKFVTRLSMKFLGEEPPGTSEISIESVEKEIVRLKDRIPIIGSGLAGLTAALKLSEFGINTIVVDLNESIGGFLSGFKKVKAFDSLNDLVEKARSSEGIHIVKGKYIGSYEEGKYVITDKEVIEISPKSPLIYAGGSESPPPIAKNNDLPGIISASYCLELLSVGSFRPKKVAVIGSNTWATKVAEELSLMGIKTYLLVARKDFSVDAKNVDTIESDHVSFEGSSKIEYVKAGSRRVEVDVVVSGIGEYPVASPLYAVGYRPCLNKRDVLVPFLDLNSIKDKDFIIPAGSCLGISSVKFSIESGECAAAIAAAGVGKINEDDIKAYCNNVLNLLSDSYSCSSSPNERPKVWISGDIDGLQFVDMDEDITLKDVIEAWENGYRDMESIKRATGLGTGLDQGLFSAHSSALILSFLYKISPEALGLFRNRPPHSLPQVLALSELR